MHIAYVCADLGIPVFGRKGCSIHVQEVIRALCKRGAQVDLFARPLAGDTPSGLETICVHGLPVLPSNDRAGREQSALAANQDLLALLQQEGPFDLVYERYSLWSFAGMEFARACGIPGLLEVNAPLIEEQAEHRVLLDRASAERVAARAFRAAVALIAVSEEVADYLQQFLPARGRVHVIPNGVDPERFPPGLGPAYPSRAGVFTVGFVGTLKPWHGLETLVEAFDLFRKRTPDCRLLIVGDGPERQKLDKELAERGLMDMAHFTGSVAPSEVPGLLASMDAAVAPYPKLGQFYFSPLKVYEYMAAGLPIVASRMGQLTSLIDDSVNGLLCPPGDPVALAEALGRLQRDRGLCDRLGTAARATVLREHTWDAVAHSILRLAGSVLEPSVVAGRN